MIKRKRDGTTRLGIGVSLTVVLVAALATQAAAQERLGILTAFQGKVSIVRPTPPPGQVLPARAGEREQLFQGDVVKTDVGAMAKILLRDDTLLTLSEETELEITEALFEPAAGRRSTTVRLLHGVARAVVLPLENPHPESRFSIDTPTAVIGVRGSEAGCKVIKKKGVWKTKCCSRRDIWDVEHKDPSVSKRKFKLPEKYCTECFLGESCRAPWPMSATDEGLLFPTLREMASTLPRPGRDVPVTGVPIGPEMGPPKDFGPPPLREVVDLQPPSGQDPGNIPDPTPPPPSCDRDCQEKQLGLPE